MRRWKGANPAEPARFKTSVIQPEHGLCWNMSFRSSLLWASEMAEIFVSYASENAKFVGDLVRHLVKRGFTVWWDNRLRTGERYRDRIVSELQNAIAVIVIWSPEAIKSPWVTAEALAARGSDKLFPFRMWGVSHRDIPKMFDDLTTPSITSIDIVLDRLLEAGLTPTKERRFRLFRYIASMFSPAGGERNTSDTHGGVPTRLPRRELATRTNSGVTFKMAGPADLHPVSIVAQCLDNQWAPKELLVKQVEGGLSLADVAAEREPAVRRGFIRSLLSAQQVIVNRAFLFNNHVLASAYSNPQERPAFERLLSDSTIVPYLFSESSPVDEVRFPTLPESANWKAVAASSDLTCLRLDWDEDRNRRMIRDHLSQKFHLFAQTVNKIDPRVFCADLQLEADEARISGLKEVFFDMARLALDISSSGRDVTRDDLNRVFVTPDGADTSEGRIDRAKPFALELKQLVDLKYNVNLPDALDRFALTPLDSPPRSLLQEVGLMMQGATKIDAKELVRIVSNIRFENVLRSAEAVSLDQVPLPAVIQVRSGEAFSRYIEIAAQTMQDQQRSLSELPFCKEPDRVSSEMTRTYLEVLKAATSLAPSERVVWQPKGEVVVRFLGTGLAISLGRTAGIEEVFASMPIPEDFPSRIATPILVELVVLNAFRKTGHRQHFGVRLPLLRSSVESLKDCWDEIVVLMDLESKRGTFSLNRMPVVDFHRRHERTAGVEMKDQDEQSS